MVGGSSPERMVEIFLFTTASRPALGPNQPLIQLVPGALSVGANRPGNETDHSPPSGAEVKNAWSYTFTPPYVFKAWCSVKKSVGTILPLPFTHQEADCSSPYYEI
jgi:hypothetical protein